jgi:hypothetical protein
MTYWQTYRPWLIHLLNQRIHLSGAGFCPTLLQTAVSLKNLIKYNGYRSDTKLAAFILRKQREIRIIIPSNRAHESQLNIFKMALEQAKNFQFQDT